MKHELAQMRTQDNGAIVNCSSLGGHVGLPGRAAYHASKHGVIGLTRSAALEYAPRGIRITAICPGTIETPMIADMAAKGELDRDAVAASNPIRRLGTADEIATSVLWLCSSGASFVTGVALPVDGGYTAESSSADMVSCWEGTARAYEISFGRLCAEPVGPLIKKLGPSLDGERLLDVGCGPGTVAAAACRAGFDVVGVDADWSMVELAHQRHPALPFLQAALPELPFLDGAFDAVAANFVINHSDDPRAAVREL